MAYHIPSQRPMLPGSPVPPKSQRVILLLRKICSRKGRIDSSALNDNELRLIQRYPNLFGSNGKWIFVKTDLCLCKNHGSEAGCSDDACSELHICFFYITGSCKFPGDKCKFGHDFNTQHNASLLQNNMLFGLADSELITVFTINRSPASYPRVCSFYNSENGCKNDQSKKVCPFLHICKFYLADSCESESNCKKSHDIKSDQCKAVLKRYGVSTQRSPKEVLEELREALIDDNEEKDIPVQNITRKVKSIEIKKPEVNDDEVEICTFNLSGVCNYKTTCRKYHHPKIYNWQYKILKDQAKWTDFGQNSSEAVETSFCRPIHDSLESGGWRLNFVAPSQSTFDGKKINIRRLSTISHVAQLGNPFGTKWKWYWQNEQENWVEYGEEGGIHGHRSDISEDEIEQKYLENKNGQLKFKAGIEDAKHSYVMDFTKMIQKNIKHGTERRVRRRPVLVANEDAGKPYDKRASASIPKAMQKVSVPSHWDMNVQSTANNMYYQQIKISESGNTATEYKKIATIFQKTIGNNITSISRIQNIDLWENFQIKKTKLQKRNPGSKIKEEMLFHGTRNELIDPICQQGFDFRVSGSSSGTKFGKGAYFARNASYSAKYSKSSNKMFVARVLVGDFAPGVESYTRPPPIDPCNRYGDLYDSCVDNMSDPRIFVVFSQEQAYPEYIIEYQ